MEQELNNHNCIAEQLSRPLAQFFAGFIQILTEHFIVQIPQPDFSTLETQTKKTGYELESVKKQLEILGTNNHLLENANETIQKLNEQFYDERVILPMVRSLFPILDQVEKTSELFQDQESAHQETAAKHLAAINMQLEQFLAVFNIDQFRHETEEQFDPKVMKPLKTISTNDTALDGLIAESMQCGFKQEQRILRMESVSLYKYEN